MTSAPAHGKKAAIMVGHEPPIDGVVYHPPEPDLPHDSGFTVLLSDAPHADDLAIPNDPRLRTFCLHCLLDEHPEVGRGLDLAREHGEAARDPETGEWST